LRFGVRGDGLDAVRICDVARAFSFGRGSFSYGHLLSLLEWSEQMLLDRISIFSR
jgi:hypothetical protein